MAICRPPVIEWMNFPSRNDLGIALVDPDMRKSSFLSNIVGTIMAYCYASSTLQREMTQYDNRGHPFLISYVSDTMDAHTFFSFDKRNNTFYVHNVVFLSTSISL